MPKGLGKTRVHLSRYRKPILQAGLIVMGLAVLFGGIGSLFFGSNLSFWLLTLTMGSFAMALLLAGALMPKGKGEKWGSMFPMVGYDRGYDNMVVRGPWQRRLDEMDEQQKQRRKRP